MRTKGKGYFAGELMGWEGSGVRRRKSGEYGVIVIYTCMWYRLNAVSVNSIMGIETIAISNQTQYQIGVTETLVQWCHI